MDDTYHTIASESEGLYKDKGSKFIAKACPVLSEEQIRDKLLETKKDYYDARHHCYAWLLGYDQQHFRVNDDGEPSGTAGKPIFGQIRSAGITNVLIIVVRYFGGIKLGVRGLINAYKGAAHDAIANAEIIEKIRQSTYQVLFDYAQMNDVMRIIKEYNLSVEKLNCQQRCMLEFSVRMQLESSVLGYFSSIDGPIIKKLF